MALQLGALRDALMDAGASEDKANKASEEVAGYEHELGNIKGDLRLLKWIVGSNFAASLAILLKLFVH